MLNITTVSGVYQLKAEQLLPISIEHAWQFFSNPENLSLITPKSMGFVITTTPSKTMYAGQIIGYKVKPLPFITSKWITEITQVNAPNFFIDEQRQGPYSMWHHEHHFKENDNGVLMTDIITYKLPYWFMGKIAHGLFIKNKLKQIFEYRKVQIERLFPINHIA